MHLQRRTSWISSSKPSQSIRHSSMKRPLLLVLIAAIMVLGACRTTTSTSCRPEQYGFEEWTVHPEELGKAVELADGILNGDGKFRLITSHVVSGSGQHIS